MNIFRIFLESGIAVQIIMVILVFFSIWSWAIFFKKIYDLRVTKRKSQEFLKSFRFHENIEKMYNLGHLLNNNVYGRVLRSGLEEFKFIKANASGKVLEMADNIKLAMDRAKTAEIESLENSLPFLGTIVAASPFLGLLGTVWGIMEAFLEIRARGSAHIMVVAPGITDALISTVYGLLVAIPALVFNNLLRSRIIGIESQLDSFISEAFVNIKRGLVEKE
jgi:biopolymer transport protein TolQ